MQFASIGSGSKGNGTLVSHGETILLIDCGFSLSETRVRLQKLKVDPAKVTAILVTHEHGDHAKGVGPLARALDVPVFVSHGTYRNCKSLNKIEPTWILLDTPFKIGTLTVEPVAVPHDAKEPCQFVIFSDEGHRLGILSDCGHITRHMIKAYADCHVLMLECNHDLGLLEKGPYPPSLKKRVAGNYGHLNNEQSGLFLQAIKTERLSCVCITHLSEKNNDPELAIEVISKYLDPDTRLELANQDQGIDWNTIELR